MSIRKLIVQYVGNVLLLPKLERDVMRVYERDRIGRTVREYVPIVRCKDCKRNGTWSCMVNHGADEIMPMDDDDFCSWGERREE